MASKEMVHKLAEELVAVNNDRGRTYDNSPNVDETEAIIWRALAAQDRGAGQERWIPVSERLPETDERVLVWFNEGKLDGWHTRFGRICQGHWRPEGGNGNFNDRITHWQPLPDPPKPSRVSQGLD